MDVGSSPALRVSEAAIYADGTSISSPDRIGLAPELTEWGLLGLDCTPFDELHRFEHVGLLGAECSERPPPVMPFMLRPGELVP